MAPGHGLRGECTRCRVHPVVQGRHRALHRGALPGGPRCGEESVPRNLSRDRGLRQHPHARLRQHGLPDRREWERDSSDAEDPARQLRARHRPGSATRSPDAGPPRWGVRAVRTRRGRSRLGARGAIPAPRRERGRAQRRVRGLERGHVPAVVAARGARDGRDVVRTLRRNGAAPARRGEPLPQVAAAGRPEWPALGLQPLRQQRGGVESEQSRSR